jgi:hypothetical protein
VKNNPLFCNFGENNTFYSNILFAQHDSAAALNAAVGYATVPLPSSISILHNLFVVTAGTAYASDFVTIPTRTTYTSDFNFWFDATVDTTLPLYPANRNLSTWQNVSSKS